MCKWSTAYKALAEYLILKIVLQVPNEIIHQVLSYLPSKDLLALRRINQDYLNHVHAFLHERRVWAAECRYAPEVVFKSDGIIGRHLETARDTRRFIQLERLRRMNLVVYVRPGCRQKHRSITKLAKWIRKFTELHDLQITVVWDHARNDGKRRWNAVEIKEVVMRTMEALEVQVERKFRVRFRVEFTNKHADKQGCDATWGIKEREEFVGWQQVFGHYLEQRLGSRVVRRTSERPRCIRVKQ
jgi:hypothetical protein